MNTIAKPMSHLRSTDRRTKSEAGPTFAFPRSIRTFSKARPSTSSARALAIATGSLVPWVSLPVVVPGLASGRQIER